MYVVRRVWTAQPGQARRAATLVAEIGRLFEAAGKRSASRVYFNSGTVPGEKNLVYMEWVEETIASPYRDGTVSVDATAPLNAELREITTGSDIEFYELMTPEKGLDVG